MRENLYGKRSQGKTLKIVICGDETALHPNLKHPPLTIVSGVIKKSQSRESQLTVFTLFGIGNEGQATEQNTRGYQERPRGSGPPLHERHNH